MVEVLSIENKIEAVSGTITEKELASLKTELSTDCLNPEKLTKLRDIIEAKSNLQEETKQKLRDLLKDCTLSIESREFNTSSFEQAFAGTKSEMFDSENIKKLGGLIDGSFPDAIYNGLKPKQQENIRLAMMEKLLKDSEIQKLFDMKIGILDILGNLTKGNGPKTEKAAEEAKTNPSVSASISQAEMIFTTINARLAIATKPLSNLLQKNNNPAVLLSNPKAIAEYNGGEILEGIQEMNKTDLSQYIATLNGDVRKIDAKIFPMEDIKEKGMNFLSDAPSFLVDFFKWLLKFEFIAKLLGYKDSKDALGSIDEEFRQRKSLNVLREFGKVTSLEGGQAKEGEYSGKIDILKGKDLSKINRKKMADFFTFTKEEKIDTTTPEFWMEVFNKNEIITKDADGKDTTYKVDEIKEGDLKDDFKGLYGKLNELFAQKKKKEYQNWLEKKAEVKQKKPVVTTVVQAPTPRVKSPSPEKPVEKPKDDGRTVLVKAFESADKIPFKFENETVDFNDRKLIIGTKRFELKLSSGGFIEPSVSDIELLWEDVRLKHTLGGSKDIKRAQIIAWIPTLITMWVNDIKEITWDGGKLIITRVA